MSREQKLRKTFNSSRWELLYLQLLVSLYVDAQLDGLGSDGAEDTGYNGHGEVGDVAEDARGMYGGT